MDTARLLTKVRWPLAGLIVAGMGYGALQYQAAKGRPSERYVTVSADRGNIVAKVTATGTLSALVTVQVGSQVSGRIQEILVDFNSPVKKGQLIARIDRRLLAAEAEKARANHVAAGANLVKARAELANAARQLQRFQSLRARRLIAQSEVDTAATSAAVATANVEVARGNLEQARASLSHAETNLAYTDIRSPTDGIVIARSVDVGQTVAASLQAPTLFLIAEDLAKMQVDTSVAEADIGKVTAGMAASFSVDAYPGELFPGTVRQIRNAPQTVQNVVTYDAVVDVDNVDFKLRPGMTANVTFVYAERTDVLRIPNAALRFRPPSTWLTGAAIVPASYAQPDRRGVWVQGRTDPQPIGLRIGISDGNHTELIEGALRKGDRVIIEVITNERKPAAGAGGFRRMF